MRELAETGKESRGEKKGRATTNATKKLSTRCQHHCTSSWEKKNSERENVCVRFSSKLCKRRDAETEKFL